MPGIGASSNNESVFFLPFFGALPSKVTTVYVNRGKTFRVTSDNFNVKFTGLRFEISVGSDFSLSLAAGEDVSTATFTGITGQASENYLCFITLQTRPWAGEGICSGTVLVSAVPYLLTFVPTTPGSPYHS